jgi:predicted SnoaL-like aldol condensation-catalyzing enzyme
MEVETLTVDVDNDQQTVAADVEKNKETVLAFLRLAFAEKRGPEAVARCIGSTYIQHNPKAPDGPEAFVGMVSYVAKEFPDTTQEIKRVIAEGDLVVVHSVMTLKPSDRDPTATVDIFRLEDGKIVEHWDVAQRIPAETVSGHPMV